MLAWNWRHEWWFPIWQDLIFNLFVLGGTALAVVGLYLLVHAMVTLLTRTLWLTLRHFGVWWHFMAYMFWSMGSRRADIEAALFTALDSIERRQELKKQQETEETEEFIRRREKMRAYIHRGLDWHMLADCLLTREQAAGLAPGWVWKFVTREEDMGRHTRVGWHQRTGWFVLSHRIKGMAPIIVVTESEKDQLYGPL